MQHYSQLFIEIWQEACRHIQIAESCTSFHAIIAKYLPVEQLLIFRLNRTTRTLEPLAVSPHSEYNAPGLRHLLPQEAAILQKWAENDNPLRWNTSAAPPPEADALLQTHSTTGSWLAAPVSDTAGHTGFVAMRADNHNQFKTSHEEIIQKLREPLAAALQNDLRLRELHELRNAAEADKSAAMRRLGREKLSTEIVGSNGGLRSVMQRVEQVAQADVPVLIIGETGTGKEVIARAVHEHSQRANGPFVRVNSGAIPPELIDSELFGHEKGAFTGANTSRHGWFERADGGTLLLDEIGELSLPAQIRLLRALQEGEIQRVGGNSIIHVNVRVIAATHRDLPAMVQTGKFREDLWYRLNVFPVVLPPLRERKSDLHDLTAHFCERAAHRFGFRVLYPDQNDLATLADYDWPGNIRELASVIDRAVILGEGEHLDIQRALGGTYRTAENKPGIQAASPPQEDIILPLNTALRRHIESALQKTHGRIDGPFGAARILEINPHTLRAKMRKLGINRNAFRM